MFLKSFILCMLLLHYISVVTCLTKVACAFSDETCTTETFKHQIKFIAPGNPLYNIESSEPVREDVIRINKPNLNYTLSKVSMSGLLECELVQLKFDTEDSFYYYTYCPRLTIVGAYEINGELASKHLEGKGNCKITQSDYHIGIKGQIETYMDSEGKPHHRITRYDIDLLDVRGNVIYEFENLFNGDEGKAKEIHQHINKNWKKVAADIQYPTMYPLIGKLFDNINSYLKAVTMDDIFYKYV